MLVILSLAFKGFQLIPGSLVCGTQSPYCTEAKQPHGKAVYKPPIHTDSLRPILI